MSRKINGVFINTARASCSIHESGKMVYSCLSHSENFNIDYYSLDMIDVAALSRSKSVELKDGIEAASPQSHYDFWVFNWHFITMAMDLDPKVIAALSGPKFTVVLELAPGNPLQLVPPGIFDAHIALDPGASRTGTIYPFPRPLDGEPRQQSRPQREIPVVGSFGFATPGKGFENLVQAVNEEFDRAIVRINIPSGDFIGSDVIHRTSYARHIENLCKFIAKPGIEVRFTYNFMHSDELIDWCSQNDINCFMYTRCQPGLSATTDQAIISGQPLVTSSNDTFRHIHQYIPPYPLTSLREAMASTRPQVEAMQRDWSKAAFNQRFGEMLSDFGIATEEANSAPQTSIANTGWYQLLVASPNPLQQGLSDRINRLGDAMRRTGKYQVKVVEKATPEGLKALLAAERPDALLLADGEDSLLDSADEFPGPIAILDAAILAIKEQGGKRLRIPFAPIVPYQTVTAPLEAITTVWMAGFAAQPELLESGLKRIAAELPGARVHVLAPPDFGAMGGVEIITSILQRQINLTATLEPIPDSGEAVIAQFAASHLIVVNNDPRWTDHLQNIAELAMITERAVALVPQPGFPQLSGLAASFDDLPLTQLIELGARSQILAVSAYAEGRTYARIDSALKPYLGMRRTLAIVDAAPSEEQVAYAGPSYNQEELGLVHELYLKHLGRGPDPQGLQHYLHLLSSGKSAKQIEKDITKSKEARTYREARGSTLQGAASVKDLLALSGPQFVRASFQTLLGREPDAAGLAHHLGLLEDGESREAILAGIYLSPEGQSRSLDLRGLDRLITRQDRRWSRWLDWRRSRVSRATQRRALNVAEHRISELAAELARLPDSTPSLQAILDLLPQVPSVPPGPVDNRPKSARQLTMPKGGPGTIYLLAQIKGYSGRANQLALKRLAEGLLAEGKLVRLITWDPATKRFELLSRDSVVAEGWQSVLGDDVEWYASEDEAVLGVEKSSIAQMDLLVVFGPIRAPTDPEVILETNIVLESRRLDLQNLFIFDGATALASRPTDLDACSCEEQYMQALLLADCLVATSSSAAEELEVYLSGYQKAVYAPVRATVNAPGLEDSSIAWRKFASEILQSFVSNRDPLRYLDCELYKGSARQSTSQKELVKALIEVGLAPQQENWTNQRAKAKIPKSASPAADGVAQGWTIMVGAGNIDELASTVAKARKENRRTAIVLLDEADLEALRTHPKGFDTLTAIDLLACSNEILANRIWTAILGTRLRFASAKDRLVCLSGSECDQPVEMAAKLVAMLAERQPQAWQSRLPSVSFAQAKQKLPGIQPRPKLSLCISTYNRAKWLRTSLANIARQIPNPRSDLEIVVVDNTSTDETSDVPNLFQDRPDFRFYRNPSNVGMLGNLAVTAQRAKGEFVWILGDDDLTRTGVIDNILKLLSEKPQLELVYMNYGYTSEPTPDNVHNLEAFLDAYNVLQPPCEDEEGDVASIAAKTENFYTAIYSHIYRRDHAIRSYCQDTSGRIFSTMRSCIPTTCYVLSEMPHAPAYWIGEPCLVVNSNVSWADYGPMLDLEHLPEAWDMAERIGCPVSAVDQRRSNRLWLVEMMWKQLFEDDRAGNSDYISPSQVIMRFRHLPEFEKHEPEFKRIYSRAHDAGKRAAQMSPEILFAAFAGL